jgi:hypothetical protein
MSDIHEGGCLCGAVRYRATGAPVTALVCHCRFCKRASGTAFQIPVFFQQGDVEFRGDPLSVYEHRSETHGRMLRLQFCPRCATRVGLTIERAPQFQLIAGGTFDDPTWFETSAHIFTESALPWMAFPPDVRCYLKHFITEENAKEKPLPRRTRPWRHGDAPE